MPIKHLELTALFASALFCSAQTVPGIDPTLDAAGLPFYVKLIPQPVANPWHKITEQQRFDLYAELTFSPAAGVLSVLGGAIDQGTNSPKSGIKDGGLSANERPVALEAPLSATPSPMASPLYSATTIAMSARTRTDSKAGSDRC